MAAADRAWQARDEGFESLPSPVAPAQRAVDAYRAVLDAQPTDLEAMWKLLRAIEFRGEFTGASAEERKQLYTESAALADAALAELHGRPVTGGEPEQLAAEVAERPHAAAVHYWAALHWGLYGDTHGAMSSVRRGVAKRIRVHAETSILLDETVEDAGGSRLLGRMHAEAPKVPLFTGWIDRDEAVRLLERAYELAPEHPYNRLFLADAWLAFRPERQAEALALLDDLLAEPAPASARAELARALEQAGELRASHESARGGASSRD